VEINGFGCTGRNALRCWPRGESKPFEIVANNVGSMGAETGAHLLRYDTVLGTLQMDVSFDDDYIAFGSRKFKVVTDRVPEAMPWSYLGVEVVIESTGAFNSLDGGSKHRKSGAKNEGAYDPKNDVVVSKASRITNGMASVCKVPDGNFEVKYGLMTTTHSYTGDQMILDVRHRDLRLARAGACTNVPTSTGAAKAVAAVLPTHKGKPNGIALRVFIVDLVAKVGKKTSAEDVNAALKKASDGAMTQSWAPCRWMCPSTMTNQALLSLTLPLALASSRL